VKGMDINPILVRKCKKRAKKLELEKLVKVERVNFWKMDFAEYDLIFLFGVPYIMKKLEKKFLKELKPGTRVVSNLFEFPDWEAEKIQGDIRVYRKK